jgi:hypothetical protein
MVSLRPFIKGVGSNIEVKGSLVPDSNIEYDLGSATMRWRDLFLSGNTINLGDTAISRDKTSGGISFSDTSGNNEAAIKLSQIYPAPESTIDASASTLSNVTINSSNIVSLNQISYIIEQIRSTNEGDAVSMVVNQTGLYDIADFQHDGTSIMKIAQGGSVLINSPLQVVGPAVIDGNFTVESAVPEAIGQITVIHEGAGAAMTVDQKGAHTIAEFKDGAESVFKIADGGNVGMGTTSPAHKLHVVGAAFSTNGFVSYSDARLKTNVVEIDDAISIIAKMRGVRYDRLDTPEAPRRVGLIAQEVEAVLPEVVNTDADGMKSIDYDNIVALLVQAIKEQKADLSALKASMA